ncbi:MAG: type III-A CRISPR-associated RAMP protein Csm5 [Ruminococcus sp.]|nr:type III-A CRISPR-associated RAMP protein Csm5 [Ruminococcus sp.]
MNDIKHYTVTLTAAGPVHIGSGREISKKDCLYLSNERKVYILDSMKVFGGMKRSGLLKDYEKYLMDDSQKNFTFFIKSHNITPAEYKSWAAYTLPLDGMGNTLTDSRSRGGGSDNIAEFLKDSLGCPYIPGSSLKGALRTAIQGTLCERDREKYSGIADRISSAECRYRTSYLRSENRQLSEKLFHTVQADPKHPENAVNDMFRGLRISDSKPLPAESLILCQKIDKLPDGTDKALPIKRECLKPGTKITFEMTIDRKYIKLSESSILKAADAFYGNYRKNFLSAFPKITTADTAGGHLIYIGGGTGFPTKTVVYPLYADKERAVRIVQNILVNTTSARRLYDPHKHSADAKKYRVSPRMRKCTKYKNSYYDFGLCSIDISEKV